MTHEINTNVLGSDVSLRFSAPWAAYWLALVRIIVGFWLFHGGFTKLLEWPFSAKGYLLFASKGTVLAPVLQFFGNNAVLLTFTEWMIPIGEFLIGLGLIFGAFTRLAAFFGAFLLTFFYFTNAGWAHGMVNGELTGVLMYMTLALFGAGRVWGIDQYLEKMDWAQSRWARLIMA
ncbi:MAG: DoxX family protein [Halanaeroarchaeum sp.]